MAYAGCIVATWQIYVNSRSAWLVVDLPFAVSILALHVQHSCTDVVTSEELWDFRKIDALILVMSERSL